MKLNFSRCADFRRFILPTLLLCAACLFWLGSIWGFIYLLPAQRPVVENFDISPTFYDRNGTLFHARLSSSEEWLLPIPLEEAGKWLPLVAVAVEDSRFYTHAGVDPLALLRACWQNIKSRRVVSGASTITSQVIRLSVPRERSLYTKFIEFFQAFRLERELDKRAILELYLNRSPFGGPLRGVEAASRQYFGKSASELSLSEAATLISLLRGPTYYRPDRNPELLRERRDQILDLLRDKGVVGAKDLELAKAEQIPSSRRSMPSEARHYADLVLGTLPKDAFKWHNNKKHSGLVCSLDMPRQQLLEATLRLNLMNFSPAVTAASAVMDNQSGEVLAYVGNARYVHGKNKSWVDCALAPRSPGSVLKPFIYLAAFENGIFTPASLVADSPLALSGRAPRNFDEKYRGPVSIHFALAESLNAPAVRVLRKVGYQESLITLRRVGFDLLKRDSDYYGDSLSIGGCEVTLYQVLKAYSTLARLGLEAKPRLLRSESVESGVGTQIFSESASWLIAESLRDTSRLSPVVRLLNQEDPRPIAFKTGTSFGLRDAWVAAYNPKYTMVVWFGDQTGRPDPKLVGLQAAAPVALSFLRDLSAAYESSAESTRVNGVSAGKEFSGQGTGAKEAAEKVPKEENAGDKILSAGLTNKGIGATGAADKNAGVNPVLADYALYPRLGRWYNSPHGVDHYEACTISGQPAGPNCPHTRQAWRITRISRTVPCTLHADKGGKVELTWPSELADFAARRSEKTARATAINITSPLPESKIFMSNDQRVQKIPLRSEGASGKIFWFVDQEFYTEQEPGDNILWTLSPGKHVISLMDEGGRSAKTEFRVVPIGSALSTKAMVPLLSLEVETSVGNSQGPPAAGKQPQ